MIDGFMVGVATGLLIAIWIEIKRVERELKKLEDKEKPNE